MTTSSPREMAVHLATGRENRVVKPKSERVSTYFSNNVFNVLQSALIGQQLKAQLEDYLTNGRPMEIESVQQIADIVMNWALDKGATHFCHWFQPLTGSTAEKHDAFLSFEKERPIEKLSPSQLIQGEPDASSFPHGGSRSTFEARGYTSWDLSSPFFIIEGINGNTLCIPTAFVTYHGDALDVKTPLLRSLAALSTEATRFLHLLGQKNVKAVKATCGCEQEYFLIDKAFYHLRNDLVMTGRTLFGKLPTKNQQLSDHYFAVIPTRVEAFMQELETVLYEMGIPAKTRHNEVAPGQFELAPIFEDANIATDHSMLIMSTLKKVAEKHHFVALLHEKPFQDVNGSGKHLNWSLSTDQGENLLSPDEGPENNYQFLTFVAMITEAVKRSSKMLRMTISGHGNDYRLGGHEAPPSIISVFLGQTISTIFNSVCDGSSVSESGHITLDLGADELMKLSKDNTDRNRTSPFAFTGNKFEFRAVGSSQNVGLPATVLNTAVADVIKEAADLLETSLKKGESINDSLLALIRKYAKSSSSVQFEGDGYSRAWEDDAVKNKGLPNLKTTPEAIAVLKDNNVTAFLKNQKVFNERELNTLYNVHLEKYILCKEIEMGTLEEIIEQTILPTAFQYKSELAQTIDLHDEIKMNAKVEKVMLRNMAQLSEDLFDQLSQFKSFLKTLPSLSNEDKAMQIAKQGQAFMTSLAEHCNSLESIIPNNIWPLPKYQEMLFAR